jgi:hypothetical protein
MENSMNSRLIFEHNHGHRAVWPDTTMSAAFLAALAGWAMRHRDDNAATIVLPAGIVSLGELVQVLRALAIAQGEQP